MAVADLRIIITIFFRLNRKRHLNWQHLPWAPHAHISLFPFFFSLLSYADHDLTWASPAMGWGGGVLLLVSSAFHGWFVLFWMRWVGGWVGEWDWEWSGCGGGGWVNNVGTGVEEGDHPPNLGLDLKVYDDDNISAQSVIWHSSLRSWLNLVPRGISSQTDGMKESAVCNYDPHFP